MDTAPSVSTEKQDGKTNGLLRIYFTSLFSMLLSCALLLGTTFAWFNNGRTAVGNEINSGVLEVDMFQGGVSLSKQPNHAVFPAGVWIPGQTVMRTVTVKNTGTLPLRYKLDFVPRTDGGRGIDSVTECFTVLVKAGSLTAGDYQTASGPELLGLDGWSSPGTLNDVMDISSSLVLYNTGAVLRPGEEQDVSIALYMDMPDRPETVMGETVNLYLKLEATQPMDGQTPLSVPNVADLTDYESEQTADITVADTARTQTVTPDNIKRTNFNRNDTTYVFRGAFESISLSVNGNLEQVFDGSQATVTGEVSFAGGDIEGGSCTVSGFTAGAVRVELDNARVRLLNNSCGFLGVTGTKLELTVHGNLVGGDAVDGEWENTGEADGICLNVTEYDLSFTDNTVNGEACDVLTINGWQDEGEVPGGVAENRISVFTGNKLSAGGLNTVAIRIRNDRTYAPAGTQEINEAAKSLICAVLSEQAANTITVSDAVGQNRFGFNDLFADALPDETANEG